jgi:hypothetical protein
VTRVRRDDHTFYQALSALEHQASAARRAAGQAYSRRETARALRQPPYQVTAAGQRISAWLPGDPAKAQVPRDSDEVWALVRLWSDWAGLPAPDRPAHVPGAASRHRLASAVDPSLETEAESQARQALADMHQRHAEERAHLENVLAEVKTAADAMREGLLHGSGDILVKAVAEVLTAAGFAVDDLDVMLGATLSADLLVTLESRRHLIEVKSAGRNASESLVLGLKKHLDTWDALCLNQPVEGGALIVNHELRLPPPQRTRQVYRRREFIASLTLPVLSTLDLFDWWRTQNWDAIRTAVAGNR